MNLHPHIKNSHAFKLPTIYLPKPDGEDPNIPNAIQELCQDIDTAIRLTVQKNLTSACDLRTGVLENFVESCDLVQDLVVARVRPRPLFRDDFPF